MKSIKFVTISNHLMGGQWLPAAAGNIIYHLQQNEYIRNNFTFLPIESKSNCLDQKEFLEDLDNTDILCMTNYAWNQELNDIIAKRFKTKNINGIVVYGGPNVPKFFNDIVEFVESRFYVDYFFTGPGEKTFELFLIEGFIRNKNGAYCQNTYDTFDHTAIDYNKLQLKPEEYPKPIQSKIYDHIFNNKKYNNIGVPLESTRGCPYSCSFCDWGGQSNSKIVKFDTNDVLNEIGSALKYDSVKYIELCDANYGIYERDIEIIKYIAKNKNKVHSVIFSGVAKNGTKHIDEIDSVMNKNFPLVLNETKVSLQTLSEDVLKLNKRSNISTEKLLKQLHSSTTPVKTAELIMGLPGETGKSWEETIFKTAGIGFTSLKIHRLFLSPNILLNDIDFQKENNIKCLSVKIPRLYLDNNSIGDLEEKGYDTETLSVNDGIFETFKTISHCTSFNSNEMVKMYKVTLWYKLFIETKLLLPIFDSKLSPDLLEANYHMFLDNLNKMPFINSLFQNVLDRVGYIFSQDTIVLNSLKDSNYFLYLISSEKYHIFKNIEIVKTEFKHIYKYQSLDYFNDIETKLLGNSDKNPWKVYKLKSPHRMQQ